MHPEFTDMRLVHLCHLKHEPMPAHPFTNRRQLAGQFQNQTAHGHIIGRLIERRLVKIVQEVINRALGITTGAIKIALV